MLNLADGQDIPIPMNRLPSLLPEDVVMDGVISPIKADTEWRKFTLDEQACERETDTFRYLCAIVLVLRSLHLSRLRRGNARQRAS